MAFSNSIETVHYNPSYLSSWLESMISELNHLPNFDSFNSIVQDRFLESSTVTSINSHSHNSLNSHGVLKSLFLFRGKLCILQVNSTHSPIGTASATSQKDEAIIIFWSGNFLGIA
ncbi:GRAS family transcription factor family protein [Forsythia ovata]|uniref:GRAS family transcription factor family protein n=1 Tax=Forsythia ovata TaxID=205694 RepID=A0ABD1QA49_9LAMI